MTTPSSRNKSSSRQKAQTKNSHDDVEMSTVGFKRIDYILSGLLLGILLAAFILFYELFTGKTLHLPFPDSIVTKTFTEILKLLISLIK